MKAAHDLQPLPPEKMNEVVEFRQQRCWLLRLMQAVVLVCVFDRLLLLLLLLMLLLLLLLMLLLLLLLLLRPHAFSHGLPAPWPPRRHVRGEHKHQRSAWGHG
jgi:hypothetical protein